MKAVRKLDYDDGAGLFLFTCSGAGLGGGGTNSFLGTIDPVTGAFEIVGQVAPSWMLDAIAVVPEPTPGVLIAFGLEAP